jgi:hypothetical protein
MDQFTTRSELPPLVWGDFCPWNRWEPRPDLGAWGDGDPDPMWIEDKTTGRLYMNDPLPIGCLKGLGELLLACVVQPVVATGYAVGRVFALITGQTRDKSGKFSGREWLITLVRIIALPFFVAGLILVNALNVATLGLLSRDMKKLHTSLERAYYGWVVEEQHGIYGSNSGPSKTLYPVFTLAPCFAPGADRHLLGGDIRKSTAL